MNDDAYFALIIEKIEAHDTYGPALRDAASQGRTLALNYHSHGDPSSWCVSISVLQKDPTRLLQIGVPELEELAHIRGIGTSAEACVPFCTGFGQALVAHYGLGTTPLPFFNGQPAETGAEG